jgi:pyruvate dehydrogenase E1 component alpha subunit
MDIASMMAELFGKVTGSNRGNGGSMHITDISKHILGVNPICGAGVAHAVGAALSAKLRDTSEVAVTFFGDGAASVGAWHESMNLAAIWKLPLIFVCENNGYAEFTPQERHMLLKDVADRAVAYGMPSEIVDGMDAVAVYQAAGRLVERARAGEGPSFLEAKTYRYYDHQGVKGLRIPYRTQEEIDTWLERDAITALEQRLTAAEVVPADELAQVWTDTREEIAAAISYGENSPDPDPAGTIATRPQGDTARPRARRHRAWSPR